MLGMTLLTQTRHCPSGELPALTSFFAGPLGGGEMGAHVRALDWVQDQLGTDLRLARPPPTIDLMLPAQAQIVLFWGRCITTPRADDR